MNAYLLSPLVLTIFSLMVIVIVIKGHFYSYIHRLFSLYLLALAIWGILIFGMRTSPDTGHALYWHRLLTSIGPFVPVLQYHFSVQYTGVRVNNWRLPLFYIICILLVPPALTGFIFSDMQIKPYGYAPVLGPLAPFWLLYLYTLIIMALINFIKTWRTSFNAEQRNRAAYISIGIICAFIGGFFDILPAVGLPLYPGFVIGTIIFCLLTAIAILKHNLLDIQVVFRKSAAYILTSALIAIPIMGLFFIVTKIFEQVSLSFWGYLLLLIASAIFLPLLWRAIQQKIDKWFYRDRYNYLKALETFSQDTQSFTDPSSLASNMLDLITGALRTSSAHLLLCHSDNGEFVTVANAETGDHTSPLSIHAKSPLVKWLERSGLMLAYKDIDTIPQLQSVIYNEKQRLQHIGAELIVPLRTHGGHLSGLLILGQKLSEQPYNIEDKQLVTAISNQMADKLDNLHLYQETLRGREKLQTWLDNMNDCVMIVSPDYEIEFMNKAGMEKLGGKLGELCWGVLGRDTYCSNCPIGRYDLYNCKESISSINTVAGTYYEVSISPLLKLDGGISVIEVFRDINDRRRLEQELRESEQMYRSLFSGVGDHIFVLDRNLRYMMVNESALTAGGFTLEDVIGKGPREIFPEDAEFYLSIYRRAFETGEHIQYERELKLPDGLHWFSVTLSPVKDSRGSMIALTGISRDITEHKHAGEELRNSQEQLRSLTTYLQTVREEERKTIAREIHDELGQTLTALKMDLVWLGRRLPEEQESLLRKVKSMLELVDEDIKVVKRISTELRPGLLDDLGLISAIEWQVGEFQNHTGIECRVSIEPNDIVINQEVSITIFRILQETLTNVARHSDATRVRINLRKKDSRLVLKVRDNGKGITIEQISSPKSLGLLGMRERAYSLGGDVKISGMPGKATNVTVTIPVNEEFSVKNTGS